MSFKRKILIKIRPFFYSFVRFYILNIPINLGKVYLYKNLVRRASWSNQKKIMAKSIFNLKFMCDPLEFVDSHIYFFGIWEPNLTHWFMNRLNPGEIFIDIGAHIGYFSAIGAKLIGPCGKVIAFEANPQTFKCLQTTINLNEIKNIRIENIAILSEEGEISLYAGSSFNAGNVSVMRKSGQDPLAIVKAIPLYKALTEEEILRTRLIKIDVEGAELSVIKSLIPILNKFSKDLEIVVEISPSRLLEQGYSVKSLLDIFESEGYFPFEIKNETIESYLSYISNSKFIIPKRIDGNITSNLDVIFTKQKIT